MKRVISILLAALCLLSLCACGDDDEKADISAKDLTAAALQSSELEGTDMLMAADDESFAERFRYYYGIDTDQVRDYAIACSSAVCAEEISVLVAADGVDTGVLTDALDERRRIQRASYELYSPESVEMLDNAVIFTEGDYAVMIVAPEPGAVRDRMRELLGDAESTEALAGQFYAAGQADTPAAGPEEQPD